MSEAGCSSTQTWTIDRVPYIIRRANESAYTPKLISIGPYHRTVPTMQESQEIEDLESQTYHRTVPTTTLELKKMEDLKSRYVQPILHRAENGKSLLHRIKQEMAELKPSIRDYYSEKIPIAPEEFAEMMLKDGCFIIQLFLNAESRDAKFSDPILRNSWMLPIIGVDLLLLENQIPFVVLEKIYGWMKASTESITLDKSLKELAIKFFEPLIPMKSEISGESPHHLLHLIHCQICPTSTNGPSVQGYEHTPLLTSPRAMIDHRPPPLPSFPSALEISYQGIELISKKSESILDVKLRGKFLEIPTVSLNHVILCIFRNLVAMEQCCRNYGTYCTSYATLMKRLASSSKDVYVMKARKIIDDLFGNDEEVALQLDQICTGVSSYLEESYQDLFKEVNKSPKSLYKEMSVKLTRKFIDAPWDFLNLIVSLIVAAIILLQVFIALYSVVAVVWPP